MTGRDNRFIFFITFLIFGILLAVQFRSTLYLNRQKSAALMDVERLRGAVSEAKDINSQLRSEIEAHTSKRQALLRAIPESKNDYGLKQELESIWLKAGLTDVKGPGIIIRLDDAEARTDTDNPELLIIHDQDIRRVLNELKKAGAQAISVNGERVVSMSEQVCAGPTILINGNRYAVPYEIHAIGDPDLLYDSLIGYERIAWMIEDKIRVDIKKAKEVVIPKFSRIDDMENLITGLEVVKK